MEDLIKHIILFVLLITMRFAWKEEDDDLCVGATPTGSSGQKIHIARDPGMGFKVPRRQEEEEVPDEDDEERDSGVACPMRPDKLNFTSLRFLLGFAINNSLFTFLDIRRECQPFLLSTSSPADPRDNSLFYYYYFSFSSSSCVRKASETQVCSFIQGLREFAFIASSRESVVTVSLDWQSNSFRIREQDEVEEVGELIPFLSITLPPNRNWHSGYPTCTVRQWHPVTGSRLNWQGFALAKISIGRGWRRTVNNWLIEGSPSLPNDLLIMLMDSHRTPHYLSLCDHLPGSCNLIHQLPEPAE